MQFQVHLEHDNQFIAGPFPAGPVDVTVNLEGSGTAWLNCRPSDSDGMPLSLPDYVTGDAVLQSDALPATQEAQITLQSTETVSSLRVVLPVAGHLYGNIARENGTSGGSGWIEIAPV
jgi:hypothetical protein